jgi:phosphoglycerol transferase MdoB-like AlkP superfamily enzyme
MNGYYTNFYISIRDYFVKPPEGYSQNTIRELEKDYPVTDSHSDQEFPDILMIMSESYADLSILGSELKTNIPVTPFLDSLKENTISGYVLASIFGGTTANSEFEALTGYSLHFLPEGATPYQQYLQQNTYSLNWVLRSLGYRCNATHPYYASGWNRTTAYPLLGFSQSTFIDDYPRNNLIREYVSDQEMFEYLLDALEQSQESPQFLFGVTMQNHGDYGFLEDNLDEYIYLENYKSDYPQAESYLTLIHESDKALEYLLTQLQQSEKKTIVLFFGDHLPKLESAFYEEVHGGSFSNLEDLMLQYTVPFFIWANYDIPEQTVTCTSMNYLGRYLLEVIGIDLPPYYQFLKETEQVLPALNAFGYYSKDCGTIIPYDEAEGKEAEMLNLYRILQYNCLFDKGNRSQIFFPTAQ